MERGRSYTEEELGEKEYLEKEIKTSAEKNKVELNYGKISSSLSIETDLQKFNLF